MLDFVNASAFTTDYGLGIFKIDNNITNGNLAYGHGGGNIGTSSYMIYLPEYEVSIAISINMMHDKCPDRILEDIIKITVKKIELDKKK